MKEFVYWCLGVWFLICIFCFCIASYEYEIYSVHIKCGDRILVGGEILIVTNVNMFNEVVLHNGATMNVNDAINLKIR